MYRVGVFMSQKRYDAVLFDLDGTLTESGLGIMRSAAFALAELGAPELPEETLRKFVGPPLLESFMRYGGLSEARALEAVAKYRERYGEVGWRENRFYPGVAPLVRALKRAGTRVLLASSKPESACLRILEHFGLLPWLDGVFAIQWSEHHADKAEIVARALSSLPEGARACMVGDRSYDIEGAKANGIAAVGVSYGYGSAEELEDAGADAVAGSPAELRALLLGPGEPEPGRFFTFEGGDGCGKSTQLSRAAEYLEARGFEVCVTREPGGCEISERVRALLLDVGAKGMTAATEALLFAAARVQCLNDTILPALRAGKIVLCDRYVDSSFAYQAHGRELGEDFIRQINAKAIAALMPEKTFLYQVSEQTAAERLSRGGALDRIESERGEFTRRIDRAYAAMAAAEPERFCCIDANRGVDEVFETTRGLLEDIFALKKGE